MQNRPLKKLCGLLATAAIALVLIGCRGAAGQNGTNGTNGTNGSNGPGGPAGPTYALDASTFTPDQWGELTLKGTITSVTMGTAPVVNFAIHFDRASEMKEPAKPKMAAITSSGP